MRNSKERKARKHAEREEWEREQRRLAASRRRRTAVLGGAAAVAIVALVVVLVVALVSRDDEVAAEDPTETVELIPAEAAKEAQASAAAQAYDAGEPVAEDYTVDPGVAVEGEDKPVADDRPVACGAQAPVNVGEARSRYPGGPARVLEEGVDYVARIQTSCGPIVIDLLETDAPVAVNSFVFLAQQGFYDGLEVFRDFGAITAVQAGSGDNTVGWDIGYTLPDELDLAEREGYPVGTVTTAGSGPYTAGSAFYIAYGEGFDQGFRTDRSQTTFGRVLRGMDVIERLTAFERVGMGGEAFAQRLFMEKVTIEER
ncbi:peptidylprolyl isomerase [Nocardioides hwasunensis]|uniref:peptidylprolyl isomerase n=1 Tax=Nocardioides hwasunensis TaxID=397258 RepID=A0ABR8MGT1_9ACTN|nr:peptidylprolyl isomerase [Nocardioides hwasunensis]MBD3915173.1 peptidylprolyl isomerase [Nocardioides hwasunensis]